MITSALIGQLRRKYSDIPKAAQVKRAADGVSTLFNVDRNRVPVMEGSYGVYFSGVAKTEVTDYTLDKDSGDLQTIAVQNAGIEIKMNFKHANFRDATWVEAINDTIDQLNGRGFFRQTVRQFGVFSLSANVKSYNGPSGAIDVYEVLRSADSTTSGVLTKLPGNWSYQSDANKILLGYAPTLTEPIALSYLRRLNKYSATSATLDIRDEWRTLVTLGAGAYYFNAQAGKIAQQGNASIQEGHFSYTSLIRQANELERKFLLECTRLKPSHAAKDILYKVPGGGEGG